MSASQTRVTFRDIAREAGVSVASVTHAFRQDTHVSAATRTHILEVANKLGYRPHPLVAALMSEVRRKRVAEEQPVLGMIDFFQGPSLMRNTSRRFIYEGARERAESLGHRLDLFEPMEEKIDLRRFTKILNARNIKGIVLPPLPNEPLLPEGIPWKKFCVVTTGFTSINPTFHSVAADHFSGINLALSKLVEKGYKNIGFYVSRDIDQRVKSAWSSGYFHWAVLAKLSPTKLYHLYEGVPEQEIFYRWVEKKNPDAVIVDFGCRKKDLWVSLKGKGHPEIVTLIHKPNSDELSGVDQNYHHIGAAAIDILTAHLYRNEIGTPDYPKKVLIDPKWIDQKQE